MSGKKVYINERKNVGILNAQSMLFRARNRFLFKRLIHSLNIIHHYNLYGAKIAIMPLRHAIMQLVTELSVITNIVKL